LQIRYVLGKLAAAILTLWVAVTLAFIALQFAPSDPITLKLGDTMSEGARAAVEARWGLNRPLPEQYLIYVGNLAIGDLGFSFVKGEPVNKILLGQRLAATVQLSGLAFVFAVVLAFISALGTAGRRGLGSKVVQLVELALASAPQFWLGFMLIWLFAFTLGILPVTTGSELERSILPALTLALPLAAVLSQVVREGMERSLEQPYALTARSRGISSTALLLRHAVRHALVPAVTLAGWAASELLTGAVIVERVFGRAGIGQATVDAVLFQDVPVLLGVALIGTLIFTVVNTVVDIAQLWIDPRLRGRL
jgi:peptide/nickel transport system permease protein